MIIIVKLLNGDEIIGELEESMLTNIEYYNIINPMTIVGGRDDDGYAGMRLRDFFILSNESMLTLAARHVLTTFEPTEAMSDYYLKAINYSISLTKPMIEEQIKNATYELMRTMEEEERALKEYTQKILKATGSTLQ